MKIEIKAEPRSVQGTGASRRLRRGSKVPGVVYGAGKDAQSIEVDHKDLWFKLKMEAFHASILDLEVSGDKSQVLLRDYQMHPYKPLILHVDFQRVAADRKIHMRVPLHFVNAEISPGVKVAGGQVQHVMNELDIACL
ncbi:MAG TPA: 50S ribosomal protein L25/general stress protein Ctc, partial [Usitatibacter sp.]